MSNEILFEGSGIKVTARNGLLIIEDTQDNTTLEWQDTEINREIAELLAVQASKE